MNDELDELLEGKDVLGLDGVTEILENEIQILSKKIGLEELKILKRKKLESK